MIEKRVLSERKKAINLIGTEKTITMILTTERFTSGLEHERSGTERSVNGKFHDVINCTSRICKKCTMNECNENEYHFILVCPYFRELRNIILSK